MHNMNAYGRVPQEASMEYFIKKQTKTKSTFQIEQATLVANHLNY